MARADRTYVDPSALRALYVHDERSAKFSRWRQRLGGALPVTRFGRAEIVNSIHLGVHREDIALEAALTAIEKFDDDVREGRIVLVDALWRRTLDLAAELSTVHTSSLGTRTLDVLHVASAVVMETTHFVSYDSRQLALARAAGLKTVSP